MSQIGLDKYYGRRETLKLLKKRVLDFKEGYRQNVAFLGRRYLGKSILLQKFVSDLDDKDIIPVYLDLENRDFHYFVYKFIGSMLYNFSKSKNLPLHEDVNILIETTQGALPQTTRAAKKILSHLSQGKIPETYREIISLPQIFSKESNQFCVLILDEFHHMEEWPVPEIFKELGKKIMTQKKCLYLVTSSLPAVAQKILSERLSLLFGNFEVIDVDAFDLENSQEFIQFHLKNIRMGEPLRNFLIDFTGGHPLYLQFICQELVNLSAVHKQHEVFMPLLTQALENVLFNPWGVLGRHFDLIMNQICSGKGNLIISTILLALSEGKRKVKELVKETGLKQSHLPPKIHFLMTEGIVGKNGNFYFLQDKLFRYWTKYVFQRKRKSIDLDPDKQRNQFQEEITQAVEHFKITSHKDLSSRIMELFYCFEDEAFYVNGRRYKLPFFREITPTKLRPLTGKNLDLMKASTAEGEWMIILKTETICENDIQTILSESKKLPHRPQRCILISLSDFDENVRVKALQERMWIWNEGELNTLLNLYDKPYIMREFCTKHA